MRHAARSFPAVLSASFLAVAALCGATALAQTNVSATMQHEGLTRSFIVHLPPGFSPENPRPLVVALHPTGTSGAQFQSTCGWDAESDQHGFVVVYPDGALSAGSSGGFAWNDWEFTGAAPNDISFLAALIRRMRVVYGIAPCQVYMTGFSNGAMMTNSFASVHADKVAAIAPVSGGWITAYGGSESEMTPALPVPVWTWRGGNENFTTGVGKNARPRVVQDQEQRAYWVAHNNATLVSTITEQLNYGVPRTYVTSIYAGDAPVWFTEVQGTGHVYQPGAADLVWTRFFSQIASSSMGCASCAGDVNGDGAIDGGDLGIVLSGWGSADPIADIDADGTADGADLAIVLASWGNCT
jgi:poly(3-hydroxybutyrate) depolymerase